MLLFKDSPVSLFNYYRVLEKRKSVLESKHTWQSTKIIRDANQDYEWAPMEGLREYIKYISIYTDQQD